MLPETKGARMSAPVPGRAPWEQGPWDAAPPQPYAPAEQQAPWSAHGPAAQVPPQGLYPPVRLDWQPPPPPPSHRPRWPLVAALVVVTLLGSAVAADRFGLTEALGLQSLTGRLAAQRPPDWPTAGVEEAATPLGTPPLVAAPSDSYAFQQVQADGVTPVAYDPCRPIHYVVRTEGAPADGPLLISQAIADLSSATGLTFVDDGTTTEEPSWQRPLTDRTRYGDRWSPVLIAWVSGAENPELAGDVVGQGGSVAVPRPADGTLVYVTGEVQLDAAQVAEVVASHAGPNPARLAIAHELAHVVGLGHADDPTQVMYPLLMPPVIGFGNGDRTGLARLGTGVCAPDL
jgi:hypothetical protein